MIAVKIKSLYGPTIGTTPLNDVLHGEKSLWAERQTHYTGINPLQCPNCDKPLTFVGCFFGNWNQLQHLFEKAGKDASIAAALLRPG